MIKSLFVMVVVSLAGLSFNQHALALPPGFVYLHTIDPTILQEIRYAGEHNLVGHSIPGYHKPVCILTHAAAKALATVQKDLRPFSLSLKVYDCYRPVRAVKALNVWHYQRGHDAMKQEFYPFVNKEDLFKRGYFAKRSGHSRGSTIDVTLVRLPVTRQPIYHRGDLLVACTAALSRRYHDNSIDMGTGYDCLDERASQGNKQVTLRAQRHRRVFRQLMMAHGFLPYEKEWWHYTLKNEPFPRQFFDFEVR